MQFTTQLIVGLIVATVLIGVLITLYVKIFARPPTPSSDGCQPGTTNTLGVGCSACPDASCASCTADSDCQNGGTCKMFGSGSKGVCVCPKPYSGLKCETQCLANSDCPNGGSCVNGSCDVNTGGCTTTNCQPPNCDLSTCPKCADGWATDPKDSSGKKCGICAPGRGPPGDCSKKNISNFAVSIDHSCMYGTDSTQDLNSYCNQAIPGAMATGDFCRASEAVDGCLWGQNNLICMVPNAWVNKDFDQTTFSSCMPNTLGPTYNYLQSTYDFQGHN